MKSNWPMPSPQDTISHVTVKKIPNLSWYLICWNIIKTHTCKRNISSIWILSVTKIYLSSRFNLEAQKKKNPSLQSNLFIYIKNRNTSSLVCLYVDTALNLLYLTSLLVFKAAYLRSLLQGCGTTSLCNWCPMFWENIMIAPSTP
jgi:hypothetical protein